MLQSTDESDSILMSYGDGDGDWDGYLYYSDDDVDEKEGEGMDKKQEDTALKGYKKDESIVDDYIDSGETMDAAELFPVRSAQSDADAGGIKVQVRRNSFS